MASEHSIYADHFGMVGRPFCPLADAQTFHWTPAHARANAALEYGLMSGSPFTVLSGDTGTGKTSLLLKMMADAEEDRRVIFVTIPHGSVAPIAGWILQAMGQTELAAREFALTSALQDALIQTYAEGQRTVLIFDDAHTLDDESLHALRVLSDMNTAQDQLVQIVLCGQPSLVTRLKDADHSSLAQRTAAWGYLDRIHPDGMADYVAVRLEGVGASAELFDQSALSEIVAATAGIPRLINQLCELSLIYAMTSDEQVVTGPTVRQVVADGLFVPPASERGTERRLRLAVAGAQS